MTIVDEGYFLGPQYLFRPLKNTKITFPTRTVKKTRCCCDFFLSKPRIAV